MLSSSCKYGIRAAAYLYEHRHVGRDCVSVRRIAEDLSISFHFLSKVIQKLVQADILMSQRGVQGGVSLAKSPDRITLMDIVQCLDGPELFKGCVLGMPRCGAAHPCPLHHRWVEQRAALQKLFSSETLAGLVSSLDESAILKEMVT